MTAQSPGNSHSAQATVLGFYYQTLYALLLLLEQRTDDAAVSVERLDDVELNTDGQTLLAQLKHSIQSSPPEISIKSDALWKTIKAWIDVLPQLSLSEARFQLVAVGELAAGSALRQFQQDEPDLELLRNALVAEAQCVIDAREQAKADGEPVPYEKRAKGCEAFLALTDADRDIFLTRIGITSGSMTVGEVEPEIASKLDFILPEHRDAVAGRLVAWWDREILYSLCGKRERMIFREELQAQISLLISEIVQDKLLPDFEDVGPPEDYQPDGMLTKQIVLVKGLPTDIKVAIREEWRARSQRSKWINDRLDMATKIDKYDKILEEHWSDSHELMAQQCDGADDKQQCAEGLKILRWSHQTAHTQIAPFADGWNAPYYVRGSYQVLAINLKIGWHPQYQALLGDSE